MNTFAIHTLGCKVNTYESQGMVEDFLAHGYQQVGFHEASDVYVIHTCAVTNTAASKSRQKVRQAIKQNPNAVVCVVGCYVQTNAEDLLKLEGVDVLIGTSGKQEVVKAVEEFMGKQKKQEVVLPSVKLFDVRKDATFEEQGVLQFDQVRAYLKVQDGCNQFCSYCIIPFTRGKERSLSVERAVASAQELTEKGHQEIVLAGIHTGRYGVDQQSDLHTLIKRLLNEVPKLNRLRLSSIEAVELTSELIALAEQEDRIAKHFHIPLQSGTDDTLKAMNRKYNTEEFYAKVQEIRRVNPLVSISSDVIVGFPKESREDFERTVAFIKQCELSFLHVFPYSKRERTVAALMGEHVDEKEKKERVNTLLSLSKELKLAYHAKFVGSELAVLMEHSESGSHYGYSSEYIKVVVEKSTRVLKGAMVSVIIDSYDEDACYGHLA